MLPSASKVYVDIGLKLDVEPSIYLDGDVAIKVALEVSNIINQLQTKSGSLAYQIGTRTAQTVLRLRDGENQVLAGLINDEDRRSGYKVPGLGEVPVLGRLFGSQVDDSSKTEIVLSITPRILRNVRRPEGALTEFDSGTENSLGARPASIGGAAAPVQAIPVVAPPGRAGQPVSGVSPGTPAPGLVVDAQATAQSAAQKSVDTNSGVVSVTGGAAIRWQGPTRLKVGDTFALQLLMQADQPVVSVPLAIGFDPKVLQLTSVVEGEFLRQGGAQATFASRIDPSGQVLLTGTRAGETGATAVGTFATLNFRAMAAANPDSRVQVLTISPVGLGGRSVSAPIPLPHIVQVGTGQVR